MRAERGRPDGGGSRTLTRSKTTVPQTRLLRGYASESFAWRVAESLRIVREAIEQHIDARALALTRSVEASERDVLTSLIGGGPV